MTISFIIYALVNTLFIILISPLFMSIIKKVKALTQRRKGPSVFQTYYNIWKLMNKETILSKNSSWIMEYGPIIISGVTVTASLFVPLVFIPQNNGVIGNIILFLYLLTVAKFFMALSGLDAGSAFGGMGSSREMMVSAIIEPITIMVFAALAFVLNTTSIPEMFASVLGSELLSLNPTLILLSISLFIVLIVETARIPIDNPETHLELTMMHEAMILEQSGKNLAMIELSNAIKQTLFMGLLINVLMPWGLAIDANLFAISIAMILFLVKAIVLAIIIGLFESSIAKSRLFMLPRLFMIALFFSLLTIFIEVFA